VEGLLTAGEAEMVECPISADAKQPWRHPAVERSLRLLAEPQERMLDHIGGEVEITEQSPRVALQGEFVKIDGLQDPAVGVTAIGHGSAPGVHRIRRLHNGRSVDPSAR
jgi:hypothetical protein